LIPGRNDSDEELQTLSHWIASELGADVPLHFSAFHPDFKMLDLPPTPAETLGRARTIAMQEGLHYVYTGNVHDTEGGTTLCPSCHAPLIVRDWYEILDFRVADDGTCNKCGYALAGRFDHFAGAYGNRRMPIKVSS
jgi:pyruvate formate lyase activating enzyme